MHKKTLIDLTITYTDNMPVWPTDEKDARLFQYLTVPTAGVSLYKLHTGMHVGTHIECSGHFLTEGKLLTEYPLERFCGKAVLFDLRGHTTLTPSLCDFNRIKGHTIALLWTGHDATWLTHDYYYNYPVLSLELAQQLIARGITIIGIDTPSPDLPTSSEVHTAIFKQDGMIIENLTQLGGLQGYDEIHVYSFPLKTLSDASLVRVVAEVFTY